MYIIINNNLNVEFIALYPLKKEYRELFERMAKLQ